MCFSGIFASKSLFDISCALLSQAMVSKFKYHLETTAQNNKAQEMQYCGLGQKHSEKHKLRSFLPIMEKQYACHGGVYTCMNMNQTMKGLFQESSGTPFHLNHK